MIRFFLIGSQGSESFTRRMMLFTWLWSKKCILQVKARNMPSEVKVKIYKLLEEIEDEVALNYLMEEVAFYASKKDIVDNLDKQQLEELDKAISEADHNETISAEDFKKEMNEWRKK